MSGIRSPLDSVPDSVRLAYTDHSVLRPAEAGGGVRLAVCFVAWLLWQSAQVEWRLLLTTRLRPRRVVIGGREWMTDLPNSHTHSGVGAICYFLRCDSSRSPAGPRPVTTWLLGHCASGGRSRMHCRSRPHMPPRSVSPRPCSVPSHGYWSPNPSADWLGSGTLGSGRDTPGTFAHANCPPPENSANSYPSPVRVRRGSSCTVRCRRSTGSRPSSPRSFRR